MECRKFEITLISANNLPNGRSGWYMGEAKIYAEVSIGGVPDTELRTSVDDVHGTSPRWNCTMAFTVSEAAIQNNDVVLSIKLYRKRTITGAVRPDEYVGELRLDLKSLFDNSSTAENLTYEVRRNDSDGTFGTLNLSYAFGNSFLVVKEGSILATVLNVGPHVLMHVLFPRAKLLSVIALHVMVYVLFLVGTRILLRLSVSTRAVLVDLVFMYIRKLFGKLFGKKLQQENGGDTHAT